jgi:predicted transcriptional regulator
MRDKQPITAFRLKEQIGHTSHEVKYKQRQVLGFTQHDLDLIRGPLLTHIN